MIPEMRSIQKVANGEVRIVMPQSRTLENANEAWLDAVKALRELNEQVNQRFAELERARKVLETEKMEVRASFDSPLDAAYRRWREEHVGPEALTVPEFLR